jgi:LysM repeat protein
MKTKIRIPKFLKLKRKKLRATAARRPLRIAAAEYEEMAEPNMKLSRALLIVLLLHVVAVAGIIAFNAIKTHQNSSVLVASPASNSSLSAATSNAKPASSPFVSQKLNAKSVAKETGKADHGKQSENSKNASDSGKTYTVAKGDNPVAIAKRFKVSYDDLLALNHIDDPRKLQIGQKLLIPAKTAKAKKND